jgi:hypothetical protein
VLANGVVVGRIFNAAASPLASPWMWTLAFGHHEDRMPTGILRRKAAMVAFAKTGFADRDAVGNRPAATALCLRRRVRLSTRSLTQDSR